MKKKSVKLHYPTSSFFAYFRRLKLGARNIKYGRWESIQLDLLGWRGLPLLVISLVLIGGLFDIAVTLKIYFTQPEVFLANETGIARFLLPHGLWYILVLLEAVFGFVTIFLGLRSGKLIRAVGLIMAVWTVVAPLMWITPYFGVLLIFNGWISIPFIKYLNPFEKGFTIKMSNRNGLDKLTKALVGLAVIFTAATGAGFVLRESIKFPVSILYTTGAIAVFGWIGFFLLLIFIS